MYILVGFHLIRTLATFGFVCCLRQKRKLMSFVSSVAFHYSYDKIVSATNVYSTQAVIGEAYFFPSTESPRVSLSLSLSALYDTLTHFLFVRCSTTLIIVNRAVTSASVLCCRVHTTGSNKSATRKDVKRREVKACFRT